jgi:hypothetical protein
MARRAKQSDLPGMEDSALKDLESKAEEYVDARDERMEMLEKEVALKQEILGLMKKHHKTTYKRDGIEIRVVPTDEKLKIKIRHEEPPEPEE